MEDFTLVWHDAKKEKPERDMRVLVYTSQEEFCVALYTKGEEWYCACPLWPWDNDELGEVSFWAEINPR